MKIRHSQKLRTTEKFQDTGRGNTNHTRKRKALESERVAEWLVESRAVVQNTKKNNPTQKKNTQKSPCGVFFRTTKEHGKAQGGGKRKKNFLGQKQRKRKGSV